MNQREQTVCVNTVTEINMLKYTEALQLLNLKYIHLKLTIQSESVGAMYKQQTQTPHTHTSCSALFTHLHGPSHQTSIAWISTDLALSCSLFACEAQHTKHLVKSLSSNTHTMNMALILSNNIKCWIWIGIYTFSYIRVWTG